MYSFLLSLDSLIHIKLDSDSIEWIFGQTNNNKVTTRKGYVTMQRSKEPSTVRHKRTIFCKENAISKKDDLALKTTYVIFDQYNVAGHLQT